MLQLCMQLNGTGSRNEAGMIVPPPGMSSDWALVFDSREGEAGMGPGPFGNAWQLWKGKGRHAVVVRGTIETVKGMLDDVLATSILANCRLPVAYGIEGKNLPIQAVAEENARNAVIHMGFAWGASILLFHHAKGILKELLKLPAGSEIYVTGHSQGAAIATLLHSMLFHGGADSGTHLGEALSSRNFSYKSYFFAQPGPGNWQYGRDFAQAAGNAGMSWCINDNRDWVPQLPFAFDLPEEMTDNAVEGYLAGGHPLLSRLVKSVEGIAKWGRDEEEKAVGRAARQARSYLGSNIEQKYLGRWSALDIDSPCLNYVQCGNLISLRGEKSEMEQQDEFWQHHCGTYLELIQLGP